MCITTELLVCFILADVALIGLLFVSIISYYKDRKEHKRKLTANELKSFNYINNKTWN